MQSYLNISKVSPPKDSVFFLNYLSHMDIFQWQVHYAGTKWLSITSKSANQPLEMWNFSLHIYIYTYTCTEMYNVFKKIQIHTHILRGIKTTKNIGGAKLLIIWLAIDASVLGMCSTASICVLTDFNISTACHRRLISIFFIGSAQLTWVTCFTVEIWTAVDCHVCN